MLIFMSNKNNIMKYKSFCGGKTMTVQFVSKNAVIILVDEMSKIQSLAGNSMSILYVGWTYCLMV
jgi:hypothetical protein